MGKKQKAFDIESLINNLYKLYQNKEKERIDLITFKKMLTEIINTIDMENKPLLEQVRVLIQKVKEEIKNSKPVESEIMVFPEPEQIPILIEPNSIEIEPITEPTIKVNHEIKTKINLDDPKFLQTINAMYYMYNGKKVRLRIDCSENRYVGRTKVRVYLQPSKYDYKSINILVNINDIIFNYKDTSLNAWLDWIKSTQKEIFNELLRQYPQKKTWFENVKIEYGRKAKSYACYCPTENQITIQTNCPYVHLFHTIYHELLHIFFHNHDGNFKHYSNMFKWEVCQHIPTDLPELKLLDKSRNLPTEKEIEFTRKFSTW